MLFGEIDLTLAARVCHNTRAREAHPGSHKTSSALIAAAYCVVCFSGVCQVVHMGRMPSYVKLGQSYKMDCGRALSL